MTIDRTAGSTGDTVADPGDTPELLAVEMDQLARPLALIAHYRGFRFERRQLAQAELAQDRAYRQAGMPSWRAIAGPLMRCLRNPVISLIRSAATRCLQHLGAELRSPSSAEPPLR